MKHSEIYLRAAELVTDCCPGLCCCVAIDCASGRSDKPLEDFSEWFRPPNSMSIWWPLEEREPRILALLLMSEIAKDEERSK